MSMDFNAHEFPFYMRSEVSTHRLLIHTFFFSSSHSKSYVKLIVSLHNNLATDRSVVKAETMMKKVGYGWLHFINRIGLFQIKNIPHTITINLSTGQMIVLYYGDCSTQPALNVCLLMHLSRSLCDHLMNI